MEILFDTGKPDFWHPIYNVTIELIIALKKVEKNSENRNISKKNKSK